MHDAALTRSLGSLAPAVTARLDAWRSERVAQRFSAKDSTLWSSKLVPELADRLGWIDLPARAATTLDAVAEFGEEIAAAGFAHTVLLGMGGSSLAPEVFQSTFGNAPGHPELLVLDSTHPDAVRGVDGRIDPARTLFIVSSKSGSTIETASFFRYFWARCEALADRGAHFVAITDAGSSLERLADERAFRRVFRAPADVGGRYSALSEFGLVPAATIGVDIGEIVARAAATDAAGWTLGAVMGEAAVAGRDKLVLIASPPLAAFPLWIEQLVAESTGKDGKGIVPVVQDFIDAPKGELDDRLFVTLELAGDPVDDDALVALGAAGHPVVRIELADRFDIGREFYRWQVATAMAGKILGVQPFDQPDVQLAKELAAKAMRGETGAGEEEAADFVNFAAEFESWRASATRGDYVALQAYIEPSDVHRQRLSVLAALLRRSLALPVTCEFGPRFLHSTGQLHKGGAANALFLSISDTAARDLPVPETDFTFGRLIAAQAHGDAQALLGRGRRLFRATSETAAEVLDALEALLS